MSRKKIIIIILCFLKDIPRFAHKLRLSGAPPGKPRPPAALRHRTCQTSILDFHPVAQKARATRVGQPHFGELVARRKGWANPLLVGASSVWRSGVNSVL